MPDYTITDLQILTGWHAIRGVFMQSRGLQDLNTKVPSPKHHFLMGIQTIKKPFHVLVQALKLGGTKDM